MAFSNIYFPCLNGHFLDLSKSLHQKILGQDKSSWHFLSEFQRQYLDICTQNYSTTYLPFCSTMFHHLWDSFIIPFHQNMATFWGMNWSKWFLHSSRELKFFPLRGCTVRWVWHRYSWTCQPSCKIFTEHAEKHGDWQCPDGRWHLPDWLILNAFYQLSSLIDPITCIYLSSMSDFAERICNTQNPSNPIRYIVKPSLDADQLLEWLTVAHLIFSRTFLLNIVVNNLFFIDCDCSF